MGGRALFLWAVDALRTAGCAPIVLAVPEELMELARAEAPDDVDLVPGGPERQHSVGHALELVTNEVVVVHDAARPMVTPDLIRSVLAAMDDDVDAVLAAVPVDETLKRVDDGTVIETVDRSSLWRSQTPAAFKTASLKDAHRRAGTDGFVGTDESQLIERYGGRIKVVPGTRDNLKVTFPEDFAVAEAMFESGRR